jgi:precorrin-2 dehydrogenase/sirohydrochlorin ferrochelatase
MAKLFPIYLNLKGKQCLIIGGGKVAERKIEDLLDYEPLIKVVSPRFEEKIMAWGREGVLSLQQRLFQEDDLDGSYIVFAATDNNELNHRVARLCRQRGILVNAVDDPPNCDFYVPSIIRRNSLALAISTGGKSPMLARKLRQDLEKIIGNEYGEFVDILGEAREEIKKTIPDIEKRKRIFEAMVYSDILDLIKTGERDKVRERIEQCISSWQD